MPLMFYMSYMSLNVIMTIIWLAITLWLSNLMRYNTLLVSSN
jgi:preprotein translocase subunit SecG